MKLLLLVLPPLFWAATSKWVSLQGRQSGGVAGRLDELLARGPWGILCWDLIEVLARGAVMLAAPKHRAGEKLLVLEEFPADLLRLPSRFCCCLRARR